MTQATSFADQATDPQAETVAQESVAQNQEPTSDQSAALIVGERAFTTMEDVKTKIVNADRHIGDIEAENATLRAQLEEANTKVATAESLEEVLNHRESNKDSGLTQDQIESLVSNKISMTRQQEASEANRAQCIANAEGAYGEDFIVKMQSIATDLGLAMEDVDKMAESNPRLFDKTFLPTTPIQHTQASAHTSDVRTSNFQDAPKGPEIKPVLSLSSKERTAQYIKQLEGLTNT